MYLIFSKCSKIYYTFSKFLPPKRRNTLHSYYRIVASTNTCYYSKNQLFVQRTQYIRTENPLHKQSEKAKTCH